MKLDLLIALLGYSFVTSVTPGPNNLMLLASGIHHGFIKTIPHILGISIGFLVMLMAVGFGLSSVFAAFPTIYWFMKIIGGAYLLYLAWKIAISRSSPHQEDGNNHQPMSFLAAAAFQWVNPKAWVMALTAIALYTDLAHPVLSVVIVSILSAAVNLPSVSVWAVFGIFLRRFLSDSAHLKWFNIGMGILLASTLWPMLR